MICGSSPVLAFFSRIFSAETRKPPVPQAKSATLSPTAGSITSAMKSVTARGV
ncbi:MAG: hypothetical protein K2H64_04305 [Desulfovibrio sp.]|nr:hypothetical protein [Desulfovibrio sp.]